MDKKISQLTAATTPLTGAEELAIVQSGVTKKTTIEDVKGYKVYTALLTQSGGDNVQYINWDDVPNTLTVGVTYTITANDDNTDFIPVGAPNNNVGTSFVATGTIVNWPSGPSTGNNQVSFNTGAPVVTVLENTIGNIWFTFDSDGLYYANSTSLFDLDKTAVFMGTQGVNIISGARANSNLIEIVTYNILGAANQNNILQSTPIEIRVYN